MGASIRSIAGSAVRSMRLRKTEPVPGVPKGLDPDVLYAIVERETGKPPRGVRHAPLTDRAGNSGVFRILADRASHQSWSAIYKVGYGAKADLKPLTLAVIQRLGPQVENTEPLIYRGRDEGVSDNLSRFLPRVYLADADPPNIEYRFLLEDLAAAYRPVNRATISAAARRLPEIHQALEAYLKSIDPSGARIPGADLISAQRESVRAALESYRDDSESRSAGTALGDLDHAIEELDVYADRKKPVPVHGDLWRDHLLTARSGMELKVIDWDALRLGTTHSDLARLLQGLPGRIEMRVLESLFAQLSSGAAADEVRHYRLCQAWNLLYDAAARVHEVIDRPGAPTGQVDSRLAGAREALSHVA